MRRGGLWLVLLLGLTACGTGPRLGLGIGIRPGGVSVTPTVATTVGGLTVGATPGATSVGTRIGAVSIRAGL